MARPPAAAGEGTAGVPRAGGSAGEAGRQEPARLPDPAGLPDAGRPPFPNGHDVPGAGNNGAADRRTELIRAAQEHWAAALTDLGGRNTLLYFKDRRSGTLDLAQADPEALAHFMSSGSIRLTRLFRDVDIR